MLDFIDVFGNIIENQDTNIYSFYKEDSSVYYLLFSKNDYKLRAIALNLDYTNDELIEILKNPNKFGFPNSLHEFFSINEDRRDLKVTFYHPGGNARGDAIAGKVVLPTLWLKMLDLDKDNRDIEVMFDGQKIEIKRKG